MNNEQLAQKIKDFSDQLLLQSFMDMAPGVNSSNPNHPALVEARENAIEPTARVLRALEVALLTGNDAAKELGWMCEEFKGILNMRNASQSTPEQ